MCLCGVIQGSVTVSCGVIKESVTVSCGVTHGSVTVSCGVTQGSVTVSCGVTQGSVTVSCGVTQGSVTVSCGVTQGSVTVSCDCHGQSLYDGDAGDYSKLCAVIWCYSGGNSCTTVVGTDGVVCGHRKVRLHLTSSRFSSSRRRRPRRYGLLWP